MVRKSRLATVGLIVASFCLAQTRGDMQKAPVYEGKRPAPRCKKSWKRKGSTMRRS